MADQLKPTDDVGEQGFSLIELLVVISILAVLAIGVSLATARAPNAASMDLAAFEKRFETMRARAIQGQQIEGLFVTPRGHQLARFQRSFWQYAGAELKWSGRVIFRTKAPSVVALAPEILFLPNGSYSPFSVEFVSRSEHIRCDTDGWQKLTCEAV